LAAAPPDGYGYRGGAARRGGHMALEVGKKAPGFALSDEEGRTVKLSDFKGRRVVVFFYPKANTSG
jgi:peroxiredoxin Q/BCP